MTPADRDAVADLLSTGFGFRRSHAFWIHVLDVLEHNPAPPGVPTYGHVLESDGRPVGVVLLIFSQPGTDGDGIRCNMSSWYVEPAFRSYASFLVAQARRFKPATYLNISPAPNTLPIMDAQGWTKYASGLFVAVPAFQRTAIAADARLVPHGGEPGGTCAPFERDLLTRHAAYGCICFWCVAGGRAFPFVFRRRFIKGVLPIAQLVYCGDVADVAKFPGLIGRHLLARACAVVMIDANGPVAGLIGSYIDGMKPKYFKGPTRPRLGDLAYTEAALFGM